MDETQLVMEKWKKKIEGIRSDPPIDYKLSFEETVRNIASTRYSLLDIGTGTGRVIFENSLEKIYRKIVGIDIRPEMIEICRQRAKTMRNVEFHVMDSTKPTTFKSGTFDVVTAMFPPFDAREVNRLLAPGGYFVLMSSLKGDHGEIARHFPEIEKDHGNPFNTLKESNVKLRKAGFTIVSNNILKYKWIFKDEEVMKQFYEKITFSHVFEGREEKVSGLRKNIDGSIPITRVICTTVARRI